MIDSLRIRKCIRSRLKSGPVGSYVDGYIEFLRAAGYSPGTVRRYIHAIDVFGSWLSNHELAAADVNESILTEFITGLGRRRCASRSNGRLPDIAFGVRRFASYLWKQGLAKRHPVGVVITENEWWLHEFDRHLEHTKGLSRGSRRIYLRYARAFLDERFGTRAVDWSELTAEHISDFVRLQAGRLKSSSSRMPVSAVRSLLDFLTMKGAVSSSLRGAVPTIRQWRLASLPRYLTESEVERVIPEPLSPLARRDRAIVLVLLQLGLRASEVVALKLDDIDWRECRLLIGSGKSKRERSLPLPWDVGTAIADYLKVRPTGRPFREVFLGSRAPHRPLTISAIADVAKRSFVRAGVTGHRLGAHTFRHTAATRMVRRGAAFKEVSDVLGHARLETTAIYAKLDMEALAAVALPWQGDLL